VSKEPTALTWSWKLKDLMRERGRTGRSVERELGWGTGYISQILRDGPPALKVDHVLAILKAIGMPAAEFFADLYGLRPPAAARPDRSAMRAAVEEVFAGLGDRDRRELEGVRRFVRRLVREEGPGRQIDRAEIRRVVGEAVREELVKLARGEARPVPTGEAGGREPRRPA
jgi:transcriptional regulator with XRE-family HTH domain